MINHLLIFLYAFAASLSGVLFLAASANALPGMLDKLSPKIDELDEIKKGNVAVAIFFGLMVSAVLLGSGLIIALSIHASIVG